jgi:hypothetical protein
VLLAILLSPFRGLFYYSPVLILGVIGLVWMIRAPQFRRDGILAAAMTVSLLLFNMSFGGWWGGFAAGPRYLIPALPFLVMPIALVYQRFRRTTTALLALSVVVYFIVTAVDGQPPSGGGGFATVPGRAQWTYNPLFEYELPLLLEGRATPSIRMMIDETVREQDERLARQGRPTAEREIRLARLRRELEKRVASRDPRPILLAAIRGPVSANQAGVYEAQNYMQFGPNTGQVYFNSLNAGELVAPRSVVSLLPLIAIVGILLAIVWRDTGRQPPDSPMRADGLVEQPRGDTESVPLV